ncbi:F0F1 ATP synthase subunit delta [Nocardioides sp. SOB77]|uniref:ATP synthase subunit delta n=1 Tax=Nocardioides oceani TaxID=3058369 RepID=A0ABT8FI93_9ACTN|nr:F0F1 ATP synthase subunit delta [Nocardioides oceani]MDN4174314.1 F0F1 ATP synthase subunit delta [Nocardioides oceani]
MTASFRGASAESLAALTDELGGAVAGSPETATSVAGELFSVSQTLRSEGALRRFLTDASLPAEAKTGLVGQVLGGKVSETTLSVVRTAVSRRWTSAGDLPDALEHAGVVAAVKGAGDQAGRLSDELFGVAETIKSAPELRDALSDPARTLEDKTTLVRSLLDGKALPATVTLVVQSLAGTHRTVGVALAEYQKVAAQVQEQGVATVRVARDLTGAERDRLADLLSRQYGRPVHLNLLVDPTVLGGIRVEIGDDVIDGTVSSRLDDARRRLAG